LATGRFGAVFFAGLVFDWCAFEEVVFAWVVFDFEPGLAAPDLAAADFTGAFAALLAFCAPFEPAPCLAV